MHRGQRACTTGVANNAAPPLIALRRSHGYAVQAELAHHRRYAKRRTIPHRHDSVLSASSQGATSDTASQELELQHTWREGDQQPPAILSESDQAGGGLKQEEGQCSQASK